MKLNYNSVSAKVYREFYNTKHMPQSLCPYFWKLIIAYPIVILLLPLLIPTWISIKLSGGSDDDAPIAVKAFMGAILYGCIFLIISVGVFISTIWITYYQPSMLHGMYIGGATTIVTLSIVGLIVWIKYLISERRLKRMNTELDQNGNQIPYVHKPNIIIEFFKAKYNKYCPKINWK